MKAKGISGLQLLTTLALVFHTLLCLGFGGLALRSLLGRRPLIEFGPDEADWDQDRLNLLFYLAGGLYLVYAEIYLYQVQALARLGS